MPIAPPPARSPVNATIPERPERRGEGAETSGPASQLINNRYEPLEQRAGGAGGALCRSGGHGRRHRRHRGGLALAGAAGAGATGPPPRGRGAGGAGGG